MDVIINENSSLPSEVRQSFYQNILASLGYPPANPPVADLLRHYHKLEGDWLILSPIHWQATHNDAMIMACDDLLDLSDDESKCWFAALDEFLIHDHVKLHYHDAYTWLIQFDECPPIYSKPVHTLLQQSMMQQLHALDTTLFWTRFITENQMFFSEHPLNKARVGRYPINGVWIWGGGELKERGSRLLVCGDDVACDLAGLLSTNVSRYQPGQKLAKDAVLLFFHPTSRGLSAGSSDLGSIIDPADKPRDVGDWRQLEKNTVHWYWNNTEYVTKPKRWFARLMEKIKIEY